MDEYFFEVFENIPRQGPGNYESTAKAFGIVNETLNGKEKIRSILDIGCGAGIQTVHLAQLSGASITAVDVSEKLTGVLQSRAEEMGLSGLIKCGYGDMFSLNYEPGSFDLIWSEGAIFIIGFERGIIEWKKFIRPGGFLACTEASWIKENPPEEILTYWESVYPDMSDIDTKIGKIKDSGYIPKGHFIVPKSAWWDDFYTPMEKKISEMRKKYINNVEADNTLSNIETEIEMYRKYSDYYGYVFFVIQKP